jgi:hypothetical protein
MITAILKGTNYKIHSDGNMGKLAFNESWDLLMHVIEKIESLPTNKDEGEEYQFSITGDGVAITKYDDGSGVIANRVNEIGKSKLMSSFEVVAAFCCDYLKVERRS